MPSIPSPPLPLLLCLATAAAAQEPLPPAFARASAAEQEHLVTALRAALQALDDPWSVAIRARIAEGGQVSLPRQQPLPPRSPKKNPPAAERVPDPWLPSAQAYVFGVGTIEAAPMPRDKAAAEQRADAVRAALAGMLPDTDLAIASLERQLDSDRGADPFAAFLVAWRHEHETFYDALDRTAGTRDSLFYYDAMLGDFCSHFATGSDAAAAKVRGGLQASHDALHQAFLAYRQYRGFREAVALALVLPPDRPLPHRLARYEARAAGSYSLRQQVVMVLASGRFDVGGVAKAVVDGAPPLPQPLWSAGYDPFPAWNGVFVAHQAAMIEAAGSTDAFLAEAEGKLRQWAAARQAAAAAALAAGNKPHRP